MTDQERVRIFDSQGQAYKQAFQIFLDHTDQKRNAKRWLQQVVDGLPARKVFIDAGAGNGEVTRTFADAFQRTIAIEPNTHLLKQLQQAVPTAETIDQPIDTLSKGYRRRVGLAAALLHDPLLLILDEPTDGLDPNQRHAVRDLIRKLGEERGLIISTHSLEEVEAVCTRAIVIDQGRIVADKAPAALIEEFGSLERAFQTLTRGDERV